MVAPARHFTANSPAHGAFDGDEHGDYGELLPGDRVGPPLAGSGGKAKLLGVVVVLIALGGSWALLGDQLLSWPGWQPAEPTAQSPTVDRRALGSVEPAASAMSTTTAPADAEPTPRPAVLATSPSVLQQPASSKSAATVDTAARSATSPLTTAALAPLAKGLDEPPDLTQRLPAADPADPYQVRAAAVGLHPGLSRALLARLSPADYRNAGIAIQTAMAETPDSAVFVWPRQRRPELALFQVRFVAGAAPDCRRYVVTVAKDGWSTTAPPMEKCGPQPGRPRRK
jgi:hypothetical protein